MKNKTKNRIFQIKENQRKLNATDEAYLDTGLQKSSKAYLGQFDYILDDNIFLLTVLDIITRTEKNFLFFSYMTYNIQK